MSSVFSKKAPHTSEKHCKGELQMTKTQKQFQQSWKKIVLLNFIGWIFIYADRTILNPVMPNIQHYFGINNASLGLVSSLFFLTYTIAQIPFAALADKIGQKWVIGLGFIFFGIMTLFSGIVTTFGLFLIMRGMTGLGEGTFYGASYSLASENIPSDKLTFGTALINCGQAFGQMTGTLLSSFLVLQYHMHWSSPFIVITVPTVVVGLMYLFFVKKTKPVQTQTNKFNELVKTTNKIDVRALFTKNLVITYFMLFAAIYGQIAMLTWLPQFLITNRGITGTSVGWISSIIPFASIPSSILFAKMNDKMSNPKKLLYIVVPISALALIVGMTINSYAVLVASLLVYGFTGKMSIDPILIYLVNKNAKANQLSTTLGVYNFFGMIASIMAPYLTGLFIDLTGSMAIGFYFAAGILLVGLFGFSFVKVAPTNK